MRVLAFRRGEKPEELDALDGAPEFDYVWIDFVREESADWPKVVESALGVTFFEQHVTDSMNEAHPSFYDTTDRYEMLIFQGLTPESTHTQFGFHPGVFFAAKSFLITVRPAASVSPDRVRRRLQEGRARVPLRPVGLLHQILNAMADRFMDLREPLSRQLEEWQQRLLDPDDPFNDWMTLMHQKNCLRVLERVCEAQENAVLAWREGSSEEIDEFLSVRINDLLEHIRRVLDHTKNLETEIESLVQIHFSAVAHRTNEIMRVLTVVAGIFLPLTFLAGIFGMNFEYMPELKYKYSYFFALAAMIVLGVGLLALFRSRKWL